MFRKLANNGTHFRSNKTKIFTISLLSNEVQNKRSAALCNYVKLYAGFFSCQQIWIAIMFPFNVSSAFFSLSYLLEDQLKIYRFWKEQRLRFTSDPH